jgi:long-chain acyl-CoA synthetase
MIGLTQGLKRSAALFPDRIATIFGNRRRSWRDIADRVSRLAAGLVSLGLEPGDRVAVLAHNSDRYLEIYFAVAWAGGVIVPANTRWVLPENAYSLDDSGVKLLFVDTSFAGMAERLSNEVSLSTIIYADEGAPPAGMLCYEALVADNDQLPDRCGQDRELAAIFYTGGTTGRAKGVMLSHHGIVTNYLLALATIMRAERQIYLHSPPMFHLADAALVYGITLTGGTHVIIPGFVPGKVIEAIVAERVTDLVLVPTMIGMLRDHVAREGGDLSSITSLTYGASAISETLLRDAIALFPNAALRQCYGQTELSATATILTAEHHRLTDNRASRLRSAGQPMVGVEIKISDEQLGEKDRGVAGEVLVRSPGAMLGYWNQPDLTAETIVDGWVRTGDAGYVDDEGFLYLVDRVKDMIVSGGENVYSAEVENALASHPAVRECAVIGVPDERWGERVHAILCLYPEQTASADEIIAHSKSLIAAYKCPRSVEFRGDPLPLSAAGKVLKTELRAPYWDERQRRIA